MTLTRAKQAIANGARLTLIGGIAAPEHQTMFDIDNDTEAGGDPLSWGVGVGHYIRIFSWRNEENAARIALVLQRALKQAIENGELTSEHLS